MDRIQYRAALAVLLAVPFAAQAQLSDNVVKVGVLTDLSGPYADLSGPGSVLATKMAIDDFIAKEKPKFKIELVTADHQNKPDIASNKAREWFERDGVDVASELVTSSVALAVMKVAKERDKLAIINTSGSSAITNKDCNDVTIHYSYDTYALANSTASTLTKKGDKSWFFVTADYAFGHSLEADTSKVVLANGGTVVGSVRYQFPGSDFSSYLIKAQHSGAQVVGLANAGGDTINSIKQAAEYGIVPKQKLVGLMVFITDIHSLGLKATQGMYLTTGFYWDRTDETRAWSQRFFEKLGKMPTMVQAGQYSSIYNYLKAVKALNSDNTKKVMEYMRKTPINDFFATNGRIQPNGRMIHDMYLVQVKSPEETKYKWDYFKIVETIPADKAFTPLSESTCPLLKKG